MTSGSIEPLYAVVASSALSGVAYVLTDALIQRLGPDLVAKGLKGFDQLKGYKSKDNPNGTEPAAVPESTGVIGASVYILLLALFAPLPFYSHIPALSPSKDPGSTTASIDFPQHSLTTYLASLLAFLIATFLGFLDDLFDIRWRYKLPIPIIATIPLLLVYISDQGATDIVLPKIFGLRRLFGVDHVSGVLKIGYLYYIYMMMLSTFCTNSINILAGVNGVEIGQSLVIACSIALNDLLYFDIALNTPYGPFKLGLGLARGSQELQDRHMFSFYLMLPLIGVCVAMLKHNWYPARSFVGDTFCYFVGMAFAVVGILGHFSKTLALFFIPQVFNFLLSCPQLFGLVPCPRHRLPKFNTKSGLLEPSYAVFQKKPNAPARLILEAFAAVRFIDIKRGNQGQIIACSNLTILNTLLVVFGPMKEPTLTTALMSVQAGASVLAFAIRYGVADWFYDTSRR